MRLSDAIAMGRTLYTPCAFGGKTEENAGCALEMGLAANGSSSVRWSSAFLVWPWLKKQSPEIAYSWLSLVARRFDQEVMGKPGYPHTHVTRMTLDQLIDWVRSVEPNEPTIEETATEFVEASAEVLEWAT